MRNILIIMADEFQARAMGCAGHPVVRTPNIDRLARSGRRYSAAYTPSPICVPARAAFATGRHIHRTGHWCNALPYAGNPPGWAHRLRDAGYDTVSVGKLHHRSADDDNGFSEEILPMHVLNGVGWIKGMIREGGQTVDHGSDLAAMTGPGEDPYTDYDRRIADRAVAWIRRRGAEPKDRPWAMFASFVRPHFPLTCPREFLDFYPPTAMPLPTPSNPSGPEQHPVLQGVRAFNNYDDYFDDQRRRLAAASYFGLCTMVDSFVGRLCRALDETGLLRDTIVLFVSDHGESLGARGLWTKCTMLEESVTIPMILSGPGVAANTVDENPVSLLDVHATALAAAGIHGDENPDSRSLLGPSAPDRAILSQYHDGGAITGMFMLRWKQWKYVAYPGYAAQLFDLAQDPGERSDLALLPGAAPILEGMRARLFALCDIEAVNAQAFADQSARIAALGGRDAVIGSTAFDHTPVPT